MKGITVQELLENKKYGFELEVIAGSKGLSKNIYNPRIQKLGLIVTGCRSSATPKSHISGS